MAQSELKAKHSFFIQHITVPILSNSDSLLDRYCIIKYSIISDDQFVLIHPEEATYLSSSLPEGLMHRSNHWDLLSKFDVSILKISLISETRTDFMMAFTLYLSVPLPVGSFFPSFLPSPSVLSFLYLRNTKVGFGPCPETLWYPTYMWQLQWYQWFSCIPLVCIRLQNAFARHHLPVFIGEKTVEA